MRPCIRSITRDDLGPYRGKVIGIPAIYFVSILIVDYVRPILMESIISASCCCHRIVTAGVAIISR